MTNQETKSSYNIANISLMIVCSIFAFSSAVYIAKMPPLTRHVFSDMNVPLPQITILILSSYQIISAVSLLAGIVNIISFFVAKDNVLTSTICLFIVFICVLITILGIELPLFSLFSQMG